MLRSPRLGKLQYWMDGCLPEVPNHLPESRSTCQRVYIEFEKMTVPTQVEDVRKSEQKLQNAFRRIE
jgi:hypothetical protein